MTADGAGAKALAELGITTSGSTLIDPEVGSLIDAAVANGEGRVAANGALVARTYERTGRSPKDKFVVRDPQTSERVWWDNNEAIAPASFQSLWELAIRHLCDRDVYVVDATAGAEPQARIGVTL
ncbi:MAG TPA: phosphoenolpyruvate carboxykinase (ATP), partial [Actinomycetota bacterium]|nr:phosphoenolpyruvate carboxykinase (ATP) [Actinomycetota bacterium]